MAVTCRDIMQLSVCGQMKLLGGESGLDHEVTWPFIKNMDTISEWTHGGEIIFVIGAKEDISEKGMLTLMQEAVTGRISAVVMLKGSDYIKSIPKSIIKYADEYGLPLFKMPFRLKLIDVTREISKYIVDVQRKQRNTQTDNNVSIIEMMAAGSSRTQILDYCWKRLQPLTEADKVLKSEYTRTLFYYLSSGNDLLRTSGRMFIHRNTLINRMKKIDMLLGINVNSTEARNEFYSIFKVLSYFNEIENIDAKGEENENNRMQDQRKRRAV